MKSRRYLVRLSLRGSLAQQTISNFFTAFSMVAPQYPSVESDLKTLLSSNSALTQTAAGLSFIAKSAPRSPLLLQHCLSVLSAGKSGHNWIEHVETAATLVAEHFSNRVDVGNQLVELMRQFSQIGPLIAVCLGWPSSPILDELYANFTDPRFRSLSEMAEYYVVYTKSGEQEFQLRLDKDIAAAAGNMYHHRGFLAPALTRMRRDNAVASHIYDVLCKSSSSNTRASYVGLIAESQGVAIKLAQWCHSQIKNHRRDEPPEIGYDML
jgi:hypothetical protein